jgi:hypothetical protein
LDKTVIQTKIFENRKTFRTVVLSTFARVKVLDLGYGYLKNAQNDGPKCFSVFEYLRLGSIQLSTRRLHPKLARVELGDACVCRRFAMPGMQGMNSGSVATKKLRDFAAT